MPTVWRDFSYGWQQLRAAPGASLVAILSLALGIGANTVVFSWYRTLVLNPLAGVEDQDRLVVLLHEPREGDMGHSVADLDLRDLAEHREVFAGVAAHSQWTLRFEHQRRQQWVWAQPVSSNFFDLLGVELALGRTFEPAPLGARTAEPEVVLAYRFWKRGLEGDPAVLGDTIHLNGVGFTVIGVAPPGFRGAVGGLGFDLFMPLGTASLVGEPAPLGTRDSPWVYALARLQPGVTLSEATALTRTVSRQLAEAYPRTNRNRTIIALPLWQSPYGAQELLLPLLRILMIVTGLVLLLILTNLASLMLARATTRGKELGIRQALGASRLRLVRQLLAESVLFGLLGGAGGALLALWGVRALRLMPVGTHLPVSLSLDLDPGSLVLTVVLAIASGILLGLSPALQLSRVDCVEALKAEGRTMGAAGGRQRLRHSLIVVETAFASLVLVGAGLCLKSFRSAEQVDLGFNPEGMIVAPLVSRGDERAEEDRRTFYRRLLQDTRVLPSVEQASLSDWVPLGNRGSTGAWIEVDGYQPEPSENMTVRLTKVSPGHLANLEATLLEGRALTGADDVGAPDVVVVNRTMARRYWRGRSPVGRHVRMWGRDFRVVGVVDDWKLDRLRETPTPMMVLSDLQVPILDRDPILHVRSHGDAEALIAAVEKRVHSLDPDVHLLGAMPMREYIDISIAPQRMAAVLMSGLGGLALLLASLGIFGVLAYVVSQRVREIGLRIALGAAPRDVFELVLREGLRYILAGTVLGLVLATSLSRWFTGFLIGVEAIDLPLYASVAVLFTLVGALACYLPARQAVRIDPVATLRRE
jgi:macrolide transport system ATP-binding/permease protein